MITYTRTDSQNKDFQLLASTLEEELKIRDGDQHVFLAAINKIDTLNYVIVVYDDDLPVACGAIRGYDEKSMEVKRMFVLLNRRGEGIASEILRRLEDWAMELSYKKCILETGKNQPESIAFYQKHKYYVRPNFGKYVNVDNSICFEKVLQRK
jgi:putative acetyltransferase